MINMPADFQWQKGQGAERVLSCYCRIGDRVFSFMTNTLGFVRRKNDGRWEWFRRPCPHNPFWSVKTYQQGVVETEDLAMQKVEEGLVTPKETVT